MKPSALLFALLLAASCGDEPAPAPVDPASQHAPSGLAVTIQGPSVVEEGSQFELVCTVSGAGDRPVSYKWFHLGVQPRLVVPAVDAPSIELTAPDWLRDTQLGVGVRVSVGTESVEREFEFTLRADDDAPLAELAAPSACECGEIVSLIGQSHNEVLQEVQVEWSQLGEGPRIDFSARDRFQAQFIAPEHDQSYSLEVQFRVRDAGGGESTARTRIAVACEPDAVPLPPGAELVLLSLVGIECQLPRGAWALEGSLKLIPSGSGAAEALLRFSYEDKGAGVKLARTGEECSLATVGVNRSPEGVWFEPEFGSGMPLGPWPAELTLGFVFESNGREVTVRFGPAGSPDPWPEMPIEVFLPLGKRPRSFAIDVIGGSAELGPLTLRAPGA